MQAEERRDMLDHLDRLDRERTRREKEKSIKINDFRASENCE